MPINSFAGKDNTLQAKVTIAVKDLPFNTSNTLVVWGSNPKLSYNPARTINGLETILAGQFYEHSAKIDMDLTTWFYPPFPTGTGSGGSIEAVEVYGTPEP